MSADDALLACRRRGYFSFGAYLRARFGCKVHKVSLNAGFTCPNRDGRVGRGGCTYCVNESFNLQTRGAIRPVREQMAEGMAAMRRRHDARKFFAYFQAFTNTYAAVETLRRRYDEAVGFPDVVGLSIGTRPDCVPDETLDLIESYADRLEVWVEYGLQSAHDRTLERINRGHGYAAFEDAARRTRGRRLKICAHVILGLPGETHADMMETADRLASLNVDGVKLHHLHIVRDSAMAREYREGGVKLFDAGTYVRTACDFLERLSARVTVQRLVGETTRGDMLIAPRWAESKAQVIRMFEDEFRRRGTTQGARIGAHTEAAP